MRRCLLLVAALALAPTLGAQVGSPLPPVQLEGLSQTPAKSFDDYMGRLVLIEFFAYW